MFKYTIDDDNEDGEKETDDGINLEFTLKNIYKPCTSCDEQTTFTDYNLDGIYLEKGKYLALNNVDSEYRKTHQIKISDYIIIDKTENN
ncbi:unknown [Clostridium sp. CAG:609]|nr:unknown [Clostridium sp. CAG:609]